MQETSWREKGGGFKGGKGRGEGKWPEEANIKTKKKRSERCGSKRIRGQNRTTARVGRKAGGTSGWGRQLGCLWKLSTWRLSRRFSGPKIVNRVEPGKKWSGEKPFHTPRRKALQTRGAVALVRRGHGTKIQKSSPLSSGGVKKRAFPFPRMNQNAKHPGTGYLGKGKKGRRTTGRVRPSK